MRPILVSAGVFILIFGGSLIAIGPILTSNAFYKEEMRVFSQGTSGANLNLSSTYAASADAVDRAAGVVLLGAILAPVGGAILAYGLSTSKSHESAAPGPSGEPKPT